MARKMTEAQRLTVDTLDSGAPYDTSVGGKVKTSTAMMDGHYVRYHRTMLTDTPAGAQSQGFIIDRDGAARRIY